MKPGILLHPLFTDIDGAARGHSPLRYMADSNEYLPLFLALVFPQLFGCRNLVAVKEIPSDRKQLPKVSCSNTQ
jgi:hypothetical protein